MNISLAGKSAIVTGASSGIGLGIVKAYLACEAAGVVGVFLGDAPAELESLRSAHPGRLHLVWGDVCEERTAVRFTETALERFGRIDILVNNAGVSVVKPVHEHTPEEWDWVMHANVKALYWSARHVIPAMIELRLSRRNECG